MLAGLPGADEVDENDDFPDAVPPSTCCLSREGLCICGLDNGEVTYGDAGGLNGERLSGELFVFAYAATTGLIESLPDCGLYAIGGGCGMAAAMLRRIYTVYDTTAAFTLRSCHEAIAVRYGGVSDDEQRWDG